MLGHRPKSREYRCQMGHDGRVESLQDASVKRSQEIIECVDEDRGWNVGLELYSASLQPGSRERSPVSRAQPKDAICRYPVHPPAAAPAPWWRARSGRGPSRRGRLSDPRAAGPSENSNET